MSEIVVYALSTCPYCKRAVEFLRKKGADFETIYLDLVDEKEKQEIMKKMARITRVFAVPLIIRGNRHVLGYDEPAIEALLEGRDEP